MTKAVKGFLKTPQVLRHAVYQSAFDVENEA
jgi:hypothetical protein